MSDSLHAADRILRRRRLTYGVSVMAGGLLAVANAILLMAGSALLLSGIVSQPSNLVPIGKAVVSTVGTIVALYLVALPLYRNLRLARFVAMLERRLGRESYLLSASQLVAIRRLDPGRYSPGLLDQVGQRALSELASLRGRPVAPGRVLWVNLFLFVLLLGGSLVVNMRHPDALQGAMVRLLSEPAQPSSPAAVPAPDESTQVRAAVPRLLSPPCRAITATVGPPAYLKQDAAALAWGAHTRVMAGSAVTLRCVPSAATRQPLVEVHSDQGVRQVPLEAAETPTGGLQATLLVTASCRLHISDRQGHAVQPESLAVDVVSDPPPKCAMAQPAGDGEVPAAGTLSVLLEAADDSGIGEVRLRYQVAGLDPVPAQIELARPGGQRHVVVQRDLPVSSFGAEPEDEVTIFAEVADINRFNGPSVCTTAKRTIAVKSPYTGQRRIVETLAALRGDAIDLLAAATTAAPADLAEELPFAPAIRAYLEALTRAAATMGTISLFKQEDARRVATLAAALEELVAPPEAEEERPLDGRSLPLLRSEMEEQVAALDGVVEKLSGEHLFHISGRVQAELERLLALSREAASEPSGRLSLRRGMRKLERIANRAVAFKLGVQPAMPTLFTPSLPAEQGAWFQRVADLSRSLADRPDGGSAEHWRKDLESLALIVEQAAQSVEGAYAQSMTRLSSSFRQAQTELTRRLEKARSLNQTMRQELDELVLQVREETRDYIKRRRTIEGARSVARTARRLSRRARSFRPATYLKVERSQVVEFRDKLRSLNDAVGLLKLGEASILADELVALTNSMEFSLKLGIRYSKDEKLVSLSRRELEKVREARKLAEQAAARLSMLRPERSRLKSLQSDRLAALLATLDELQAELVVLREKVEALTKVFPIFFGKFGPRLDRAAETLNQTRERLSEFLLEDAQRLVVYVDDTLAQLVESLENSSRGAKSASALAAGGNQPGLVVAGKEEVIPRDRLDAYLRYGQALGERPAWRTVFDNYFSQLAP